MRIGNWLTADQGKRLLTAFGGEDLRCKRDYAMIAVLLGCGLRRAEVAGLTVEDLQQREEHWVIADLVGKGGYLAASSGSEMRSTTKSAWSQRRLEHFPFTLTDSGDSSGPARHQSVATGCQSSTRFPSGSVNQPNLPKS